MAGLRGRGFSWRATIVPIAVLAALLQALLLFAAIGPAHAHHAPPGLALASADCGGAAHPGEAPGPHCPLHPQCCALGTASLAPLIGAVLSMLLPVSPGETMTLGVAAERGAHGPAPARPWSSRAPPFLG